jgi:hypothetical protein
MENWRKSHLSGSCQFMQSLSDANIMHNSRRQTKGTVFEFKQQDGLTLIAQ